MPHRVELGITDTLEPRIVLSAINGSHDPAATGDGRTNPTSTTNGFNTDDEFDWADEPVMVTGSFLTSVGVTDTRNMSFDDIEQGYSDTCVFSSVLAAAALTTFSLESGITVRSAVGGMTIYDVRMYDKTASGSFVAISQSVAFDGTVQPEDLRPADSNEYWTTIYLRAYLDFAESRGAEYRTYEFAMESLFGAGYEETNVQEAGASLALAKQIQSALAAGRATVAGTEDSASDLIDSTYGLASNHAYTIMGIEIPASGNLSQTYVTVRNPWAVDTSPYFFDANHDKDLDSKEYSAYVRGIDGSNDGLIRLPWNVFSTNFEDVASTTRTGPGINRPLGPPVIFSPASIGPFTIGEGEHLVVPLKATESSGKFVLYEGFGTRGNIHVQNGTYDWYPPIGSVGKHVIKIRASTGPFNVADISFEVNVVSGAPTVGALQSSPSSIRDDGSDRLTLTAKNVVASVGSVSRVEFWLDKNGNNRIDSSEDVMMGIGTRQGADSVWTGYVGLEAGFRVFLTRAVRYSQIADHYSNTKSTSVTVTKAVPLPSVAVPRGDQSRLTPLNVPDEIAFRSLQDAAGHYRVLVGQSGTSFSFYVRHLDGNGNLLETDSVAETNAAAVDMFVKADGSFAVVWLSRASSGGSINIKLRWYNSSGTAIGGIVDLATVPDTVHPYVQIAGDSLGDLLVAYNVGNYFEEDIWALSVSRAGTLTREPWRVNSYTTGMQKNPTVSMNSSGDGVIAWSDADQQRIMARRFSQTGTRATEIFEAGIFEESDILIDSAIRENGEFCITWQNKWSNSDKVFVQRFSSSGTKQGSTITANKFPGGGLYKSKVSLNNAGWMVVAWTSNLQSTNCYAQVFAPNGEKQGPEFSVPSKPDESGQIVDVNLDDHGNLLFVFREVGDRFGENSVQSRLFEINLTPVITPDQSFSIAENLPAQSVVGIIRAEDPNLRTQLSWELIGAPEFSIDPQSGMLTTNVVLDRETKSSYQLTIRVTDGKLAAQGTVTVNVIESNDAPTVSSSGLVLTYTEQSPAALIADDEFVQDVDSASFSGGYLSAIVTPVAGSELQQAADRISIGNTRGVTIAAGNKVIINGIEVGLLSGSGIGVNPFRIDLNENATLTATTILLQSLQFDCAGDNPLAGRRNISITVNDGQGGISLPSIAAVDVAAINDAPGISGFDTSILYGRNTGPVTLDADTIVTDPDSVDFSTGSLTVAISSNAQNTDRIGIRNTGTAAGQIGVSGTVVSYGGVAIGSFTGTTTLVVTLNTAATPAAVQALLRSITFSSVSENPSVLDRTVKITLTDGDGGTSTSPTKIVKVTAVNDAPVIGGISGFVTYVENAVPLVIASTATVTDPDSGNLALGKLTVAISANSQTTDRIGIRNTGTAAGQIGVSGTVVSYGGVAIGSFTGTTTLVVTLNTAATPAAVQALLRSITFSSVSENPSVLDRTVKITLTDGDGGTSTSPTKIVKVTAVNDAPVIGGISGFVTYVENAVPLVIASTATATDPDSANLALGRLTVAISANSQTTDRIGIRNTGTAAGQIGVSGTVVSYGGVAIGSFTGTTTLVVTLNTAATPAAVQALLRSITFSSVSENPSVLDRTVKITLTDGDGGTSTSPTKIVKVTAVNDAPVIGGISGFVTYVENAVPLVIASTATVTDPDSANLALGRLTVAISANSQTTDRIGIRNTGVAAGQIGVSGTAVSYGGVAIGTFTGTTTLVVTLNTAATPAAVQALLRSITFFSVSENPSVLDRTVKVTLTDGDGGTSTSPTKIVKVTAVNDAPVLGGISGFVTYVENAVPLVIASTATVTDPDSANLALGKLTVAISANSQTTDRIGIRNTGVAAGQIGVSGTVVSYGGVAIGTFTGTTTLVVTLNTAATPAAVQALLRSITFFSVSENPSVLDRTVKVTLTDGDGGTSISPTKIVKVSARNDAPVIAAFDTEVNYTSGGPAVILDTNATVSDVDSLNLEGGKLTFSVATNAATSDVLGILHQGVAAGQVGFNGGNVTFGGVLIGTATGGAGTVPLVVSLNSNATSAGVQALLRRVTYRNTSTTPSVLPRTVKVTLTDGDGGTSTAVSKSVRISGGAAARAPRMLTSDTFADLDQVFGNRFPEDELMML